jgi:hypothetical protein
MGDPMHHLLPESLRPPSPPRKERARPPMPEPPGAQDPLLRLIQSLEHIRETCYVCDRAPLDDMIADLQRWAAQLSPEVEVPTVQERGRPAGAAREKNAKRG